MLPYAGPHGRAIATRRCTLPREHGLHYEIARLAVPVEITPAPTFALGCVHTAGALLVTLEGEERDYIAAHTVGNTRIARCEEARPHGPSRIHHRAAFPVEDLQDVVGLVAIAIQIETRFCLRSPDGDPAGLLTRVNALWTPVHRRIPPPPPNP